MVKRLTPIASLMTTLGFLIVIKYLFVGDWYARIRLSSCKKNAARDKPRPYIAFVKYIKLLDIIVSMRALFLVYLFVDLAKPGPIMLFKMFRFNQSQLHFVNKLRPGINPGPTGENQPLFYAPIL